MDKKGYGMMKKLWCLLLCAMFVLTGCSSNTTGTADSETETNQTADVEEEGPSMEEQAAEPLTVYLNDFDSVIPDLFKEKTGYDVEVVVGNGAETMSRIEAEKSNPQWDVVWMDSMYDIYNLDLGGQLMTDVEIENASGLTPEFSALVPEDKCFYPTGAHSAGVLVYRNDVWSEEDAPKSYADLTDPKYAGAVAMADPGVAAPAYPLAAYFMDTLGMEGGQEFFTTLFEQGLKVYPKNPQVVEALASGEATIAMLQESNAYAMIADGEPITIVWPEEGAAASTRVAAICKSTDQPDIAKAFVEFLLDPETQQALMDGIRQARAGLYIRNISQAVETTAKKYRLGVVREYVGHGCGIQLHEPPEVPNFAGFGKGARLVPGMVICVEPMLNLGCADVTTDRHDHWTVRTRDGAPSAHFEHQILITDKEPEILTWPKTM